MDRWQELGDTLRKPNTLVVNLYGGPGIGKSTLAAMIFGHLKQEGVTAEYVGEFAKDLVWEQRHRTLTDQIYIFGKQQHRLARLLGQVDVIVTDAPVMFTPVYSDDEPLNALAREVWTRMNNLDIFIERDNEGHPYNERGRYQDLNGAEAVDRKVLTVLDEYEIPFVSVPNERVLGYAMAEIYHRLANA